jgi:hypothetical protein
LRDYGLKCGQIITALLILWATTPGQVAAFPPFKSTDAGTADPYVLEMRLGLIQVERDAEETIYLSPLLRANFGLPGKLELISEFEYRPGEAEFNDGALGVKWAPVVTESWSYGIEILSLVPVRPGDNGVGVETQLLASWHCPSMQVHFNAGGFHDPRSDATENGWRASVLVELTNNSFRPGIELFTKQKNGGGVDLRLGAGLRKDFGGIQIRSGIHIGVTEEAPDVIFSFWITRKFPFRS